MQCKSMLNLDTPPVTKGLEPFSTSQFELSNITENIRMGMIMNVGSFTQWSPNA